MRSSQPGTALHARRAGAHRAGVSATTKVVASLTLTALLGLGGVVASTSSFADPTGGASPSPSATASDPQPTTSPSTTPSTSPSGVPTDEPTPVTTSSSTPDGKHLGSSPKKHTAKSKLAPLPKVRKGHTLGKARAHSVSLARASRAGRPGSKAYNFMYARIYGYLHYGWSTKQYLCLRKVWAKESGWRTMAHNRHSGAYGIPQAMPGRKMASEGRDWKTNAATQIRWGMKYVKGAYGTPCHALYARSMRGWY